MERRGEEEEDSLVYEGKKRSLSSVTAAKG
jgi:hypothetical protein